MSTLRQYRDLEGQGGALVNTPTSTTDLIRNLKF